VIGCSDCTVQRERVTVGREEVDAELLPSARRRSGPPRGRGEMVALELEPPSEGVALSEGSAGAAVVVVVDVDVVVVVVAVGGLRDNTGFGSDEVDDEKPEVPPSAPSCGDEAFMRNSSTGGRGSGGTDTAACGRASPSDAALIAETRAPPPPPPLQHCYHQPGWRDLETSHTHESVIESDRESEIDAAARTRRAKE